MAPDASAAIRAAMRMTPHHQAERFSDVRATIQQVFTQAGPDMDMSRVTVLHGSQSEKLDQLRSLDSEAAALKALGVDVDRSGRALAAGVGRGPSESTSSSVTSTVNAQVGRAMMEAIENVRAGRVATAYVNPATGQATDLISHELRADAGNGVSGMSASWTENGAGGGTVPIQWATPVATLRPRAIMLNLPGLNFVKGTSDRTRFPRLSGQQADGSDLVQAGVQETQTITETTADIDEIDIVPVKFAVYQTVSSEFWEDSSIEAMTALSQNGMDALARKVDASMLQGLGASDLLGIRNIAGIQTTPVAGLPASFDTFADVLYAAEALNANPTVFIMHPRSWNILSKIKTGIASDKTTLLEPNPQTAARTLLGHPVYTSTQITLTEGAGAGSWVAAIDPTQLVVVERRQPLIEFSNAPGFQQDLVAMRITARYGFGALNPQAISIATDVRAS